MITNLFVLLGFAAVCTLAGAWATLRQRTVHAWLTGLLYGAMSVVAMLVPVVAQSGRSIDCRVGVIGAAALLGGPRAALASLLFPVAYCFCVGGPSLWTGLAELVWPCALGTLCPMWFGRHKRLTVRRIVFFSFLVGLGTRLAMAAPFLPEAAMRGASDSGLAGAVAGFLVATVSMALLCMLAVLDQRHVYAVQSRTEMERRVLHAQKMDAIGQMTHKISHSILNSLTVIMGEAELAKMENADPAKVDARMDGIIKTVDQLSQMTLEMVAFATPGTLRLRRMDLSKCLEGAERMLSKILGPGIEVVVEGERAAVPVEVDPSLIEQVILHLAVNASEAMTGPGRITIKAAVADLSGPERARLQAGLCEQDRHRGAFGVLSVQDTGCGMTEGVARRIFEPFFTTKERPENAGLGLATVYNIVQRHFGFIDFKTRPGAGTTFYVYLPVVA